MKMRGNLSDPCDDIVKIIDQKFQVKDGELLDKENSISKMVQKQNNIC